MNITVFGCGAYGLALSLMLHKNKENKITIWSESEQTVDQISKKQRFEKALPGIKLPKEFKYTASVEKAMENADLVFIVVAAKYTSDIVNKIKPFYQKKTHVCIATKGIEQGTCKFMHNIFLDNIKTKRLAIISGPSFAIDIANNDPVGLSIASENKGTIKVIKNALCGDTFKLRETDDILGIEICGSIKNVIAIAAGIINGLGYSESTQTFLINEAMHDIKELIHALGGKRNTILSFAGVGDLILTCTSIKSRNFSFGKIIGEGNKEKIDEYVTNNTVEGYYTIKSIYKLLRRRNVKIPIIDLIYKIVANHEDPQKLVTFLISKK